MERLPIAVNGGEVRCSCCWIMAVVLNSILKTLEASGGWRRARWWVAARQCDEAASAAIRIRGTRARREEEERDISHLNEERKSDDGQNTQEYVACVQRGHASIHHNVNNLVDVDDHRNFFMNFKLLSILMVQN